MILDTTPCLACGGRVTAGARYHDRDCSIVEIMAHAGCVEQAGCSHPPVYLLADGEPVLKWCEACRAEWERS